MYVRVYVCARTWGRSAAETLRHRLALFTQRGFFLLRDLLLLVVLSKGVCGLLRAATCLAALAAACFLGQIALLLKHHARTEPNRCVRLLQLAVR